MRAFFWLLQIAVSFAAITAAGMRWGSLPAVAPFLSPFEGFWRLATPFETPSREALRIEGLGQAVEIAWDKRGVPHIFAKTERDAYVAQGYCTARDRLWQMDVIAREAGGRLAEVMGRKLLDHDLMRRRYGLAEAARAKAAAFGQHPGTQEAVLAYCRGVNAYIKGLSERDWPLEYRLLGYAPEPWSPEKVGLLITSMQWTLSAGRQDQPLTATLGKYGPLFFKKFFPPRDVEVPPIIPAGTAWPFKASMQVSRDTLPDSLQSDSASLSPLPLPSTPKPRTSSPSATVTPPPSNDDPVGLEPRARLPADYHGSNNFVLGPSRTASGHPILGNDPHLDLTLPSTWYEVQLHAPGLNVYGVSLPGAPGVVIGFNDKVAWGLTNGSDDVFDWYRIRFRDSTLAEYFYDGRWVPTRQRVDTVRIRDEAPVLDTVKLTHHGPVVLREPLRDAGRNVPMLHALRWLAHDTSDEVGAILRVQGSDSYVAFRQALVGFACPSQNFAFAAVSGDFGLVHMGRFPWKWPTQGRIVLDGTDARHDWQGWVPWENIPAALNPEAGFIASANQEPTDSTYPYSLGSHYTNPDRALRLHQRLSETRSADLDTAFSILRDAMNIHAAKVLPKMLALLDTSALDSTLRQVATQLKGWDYVFTADGIAPTVFDAWWKNLYRKVWGDDFGEDDERYDWPNLKVTRRLFLADSASEWFDDVRTPQAETLVDLVNTAFLSAASQLRHDLGKDVNGWRWHFRRPVAIRHLLRLPAFSSEGLVTGGCPECVDAQKAGHGPSWRMAVELSDPPRAFGIYPGGQSGNPGSNHYDDFVNDWAAGRRYPLDRLVHLPEPGQNGFTRLTLEPQ